MNDKAPPSAFENAWSTTFAVCMPFWVLNSVGQIQGFRNGVALHVRHYRLRLFYFLAFWGRFIFRQLSTNDTAAARLPSDEEMKGLKPSIASKYSLLSDVYAFSDGIKLDLHQSGDSAIEGMFYNGWTHDYYVGNVFVFAPKWNSYSTCGESTRGDA